MESAIPAHLRRERTQESRKPRGFHPPNPAWVARYGPLVDKVAMAYFGVQCKHGDPVEAAAPLMRLLGTGTAPDYCDRSLFVDSAGYRTALVAAYWRNADDFERWRNDSGFDAWWLAADRLHEPHGYFLELLKPDADRFETLRSSPDHPEGAARLETHVSDEIEEHAYWGSMRDRLPISQDDPLDGAPAPQADRAGAGPGLRIAARGRENLALIRSGQDWSATTGQERDLYLKSIQPVLQAGMDYLRDNGAGIGCLSCRYLSCTDEDWGPLEKSFGLACFDTLANLETWARTHPTHLAIFGGFQKYVQDLDFNIALRLYHEVTVVPAAAQHFEYLNCHPRTGLLPR